MDTKRFRQIRAQLELWERESAEGLDRGVLNDEFDRMRMLLREFVQAAEGQGASDGLAGRFGGFAWGRALLFGGLIVYGLAMGGVLVWLIARGR